MLTELECRGHIWAIAYGEEDLAASTKPPNIWRQPADVLKIESRDTGYLGMICTPLSGRKTCRLYEYGRSTAVSEVLPRARPVRHAGGHKTGAKVTGPRVRYPGIEVSIHSSQYTV